MTYLNNPTSGLVPYLDKLVMKDSPVTFDVLENLLISTAAIQVPQGTIFVGEDVAIRNHGGFTSSTNLQLFDTKILVGRSYGGSTTRSFPEGLDGSEERISVARFNEEQQDFPAQIVDDEQMTVSGTTEIAVAFTEVLPAMIIAHHLRGVSGKASMRLDTAKDPDDNNLSDEDFLALPDSALITIADGRNNGFNDVWDFDDPHLRDDSVDGLGTDYNTYTIPVDFDVGRKIKLVWFSADGNPVTFKGSTIDSRFFPYIDTDFQLRTNDFLIVETDAEDVETTDNTFTEILRIEPVDRLNLEYTVQVAQDSGIGTMAAKYSVNVLNNGGAAEIIGGQETLYLNTSSNSLRVRAIEDGADIVIQVRGITSQTWNWKLQYQQRSYG